MSNASTGSPRRPWPDPKDLQLLGDVQRAADELRAGLVREIANRNSAITAAVSALPAPLLVSNNLSDLSSASAARSALDVYTKGEVDAATHLVPRLIGTAVLVAGSATVTDHSVLADDEILVVPRRPDGVVGFPYADTADIVVGDSFKISSTNAADASTVLYVVWRAP